jgi:hypothetical protein
MNQQALRIITAGIKKLAQMDPQDEAVARTVQVIEAQVDLLGEQSRSVEKNSISQQSMECDIGCLKNQVDKLRAAAEPAARNYQRVVAILGGLRRAAQVAERPQYASLRPRLAACVKKVAGIFAEVDTVADLDKPLDQIEKAVHALYGDQSANHTYMFEARGKGHHSK